MARASPRSPIHASNRLVEGFCERRERFRAGRGHGPAILQADAEFSRDIDPRFIGEAHANLQRSGIAVNEISRLMAIEADAMAGAMRETGQFVARTPTLGFVIGAHRVVDSADRDADLRGLESD